MTATQKDKKIAKVALAILLPATLIIFFWPFGLDFSCGHSIDATSKFNRTWREAFCPETIPRPRDPEKADMEYRDMVLKQKAEEAEKAAKIFP